MTNAESGAFMLVSYLLTVHVAVYLPCLLLCYDSDLLNFTSSSSIIDSIVAEFCSIKRQSKPALAIADLISLPIFDRSFKFDIAINA